MTTSASRTPPGLGPHVVGRRVVVRRVLPGETGPTGGPAFTDVLGVMERWGDGVAVIRRESGDAVTVAVADIVSGKPVPPRPSVRLRVSADLAERRALAAWPARESASLGEWVLRASGGFTARANSVLVLGDPGTPLVDALRSVAAFYTERGLPSWAQVVVGSDEHAALESAGWVLARPGEADTLFQLASVASASRAVRRSLRVDVRRGRGSDEEAPTVTVDEHLDDAWLADDLTTLADPVVARQVLEGPAEVGFVSVRVPGTERVVARGRVARGTGAVAGDDEWAGITSVWVSPEHRRRGLATVVMGAMLEWAAERGVTTAYLQVRGDNAAALASYERLGFQTHHAYRYLTPD